jgi:hypothetical protein
MTYFYRIALAFLAIGITMTTPSFAAAPKTVGKFQSWAAYVLEEKGHKTCWIASKPIKSKMQRAEKKSTKKPDTAFKRQDVFFMVSQRPQDNVKDEVSYFLGANAALTPIELSFSKIKKFDMLAKQEWAWFSKKSDEKEWFKNANTTKEFTLKTTYEKGPVYYDDYSFQGFQQAMNALETACSATGKNDKKMPAKANEKATEKTTEGASKGSEKKTPHKHAH